jgi:Sec-independent protein translocase protein TatA
LGIQEQQEERGRKAGAAIKAFNKMLDQAEREQEQHLEGQIEEAQQGR